MIVFSRTSWRLYLHNMFDVDGAVQYRLVEAYHNGYGMSYGYNYGQQNTTSTLEEIGVSLSLP